MSNHEEMTIVKGAAVKERDQDKKSTQQKVKKLRTQQITNKLERQE